RVLLHAGTIAARALTSAALEATRGLVGMEPRGSDGVSLRIVTAGAGAHGRVQVIRTIGAGADPVICASAHGECATSASCPHRSPAKAPSAAVTRSGKSSPLWSQVIATL